MIYELRDPDKLYNIVNVLSSISKYITWDSSSAHEDFVYLLAQDSRTKRTSSLVVIQLVKSWFFEVTNVDSISPQVFSIKATDFKTALKVEYNCIKAEKVTVQIFTGSILVTQIHSASNIDETEASTLLADETVKRRIHFAPDEEIVNFHEGLLPKWRHKHLFRTDAMNWRSIIERTGGRYNTSYGGTKMLLNWDTQTVASTTLTTEVAKKHLEGQDVAVIDFSHVDFLHESPKLNSAQVFRFPSRDVIKFLDKAIVTKYWNRVIVAFQHPTAPMLFGVGVGPELAALRIQRYESEKLRMRLPHTAPQSSFLLTSEDVRQAGSFDTPHERSRAFSCVLVTPTYGSRRDEITFPDISDGILPSDPIGFHGRLLGGVMDVFRPPAFSARVKQDIPSPAVAISYGPFETLPESNPAVEILTSSMPMSADGSVPSTQLDQPPASIDWSQGLDEEAVTPPMSESTQPAFQMPQYATSLDSPSARNANSSSITTQPLSTDGLELSPHMDLSAALDDEVFESSVPPTVKRRSGVHPDDIEEGAVVPEQLSASLRELQPQILEISRAPLVSRTPWLNSTRTTGDRTSWVPPTERISGSQMDPTQRLPFSQESLSSQSQVSHPVPKMPGEGPLKTPHLLPPDPEGSQNDHRRFSFMSDDFCDNGGDVDFDDSFGRPVVVESAIPLDIPPPPEEDEDLEPVTEEARRRLTRKLRDETYRRALEERKPRQMEL